tara:strand:- start:24474 stop:25250 length:777 start_codon:yes stop_codon:yes gene_type:complete
MKYLLIVLFLFFSACTKCTDSSNKKKSPIEKQSKKQVKIPANPSKECLEGPGSEYGDPPILRHAMPNGFQLIVCGKKESDNLYADFHIYPVDKNKEVHPHVLIAEEGLLVQLELNDDSVIVQQLLPFQEQNIAFLEAEITCDEKQCLRSASKCIYKKISSDVDPSILDGLEELRGNLQKEQIDAVMELALSGNKKAFELMDNLDIESALMQEEEPMPSRDETDPEKQRQEQMQKLAKEIKKFAAFRRAIATMQGMGCL